LQKVESFCFFVGGWGRGRSGVARSRTLIAYVPRSGIFDAQTEFVDEVNVDDSDVKFTNITDKGYRCRMAAWRSGKQQLLQPFFAKADRKFTSKEVLQSATIASHRSGNERAVNVGKRSGKIARGAENHDDLADLDDLWLCWGFQANFMFRPIH